MSWVAGVDGCPGGWLVLLLQVQGGEVVREQPRLCRSFSQVLELTPSPRYLAVDMPIGLLEESVPGGRPCDREARSVLGRPRAASVFSPPPRPALGCDSFEEARGWGLNLQAFNILPRVAEVDRAMTPQLQQRVREVHPELSFFAMQGLVPAADSKKRPAGREERTRLLSPFFYQLEESLAACPRREAGVDDVLDAYAAAWSALRMLRGDAGRIPHDPPLDQRGLRMEIWY